MTSPRIALITPALADANNGNWQTAQRWARLLRPWAQVRLASTWQAADVARDEDLLIALHAVKSAPAVAAWRAAWPKPVVLVLTGTDLYGGLDTSAATLAAATRLVVLNELGLAALPAPLRAKAHVCLQSVPARTPLPKPTRHLRAVVVGHLRACKAPEVVWAAARQLSADDAVHIDHIGTALEPALGVAARDVAAQCPRYRWLGGLAHAATRARIQRASVLVHPSWLEGGAHAVIEAITCGTPVLASRIDGNLGLLGTDYDGTFAPGDGAALAALLRRARAEPAFMAHLTAQCAARAARFAPAAEQATLRRLLDDCLAEQGLP
ncbi:MAG: TIGR04348 family glycosyltransferase [Proteobacteria bacterium]|nr:TIGR04348 family glycosyltransferase [Pseudomonadota bacterium]